MFLPNAAYLIKIIIIRHIAVQNKGLCRFFFVRCFFLLNFAPAKVIMMVGVDTAHAKKQKNV